MEEVVFEPPGKGFWELESIHLTRPVTRFTSSAMVSGFTEGTSRGFARYGLFLDRLKMADVNGFLYVQPVPFGAPNGAVAPPPKPLLWLLCRVSPKLRARVATASRVMSGKIWREDLDYWDNVERPAMLVKHKSIMDVDVTALSDDELIAHLGWCHEHLLDCITLRHQYTPAAIIPVGDFLLSAQEWTGAEIGELLALLRGSSPISVSCTGPELNALVDAIRASQPARTILTTSAPPAETLDRLANCVDVGTQVKAYLDAVRFRSLGYDVGDLTSSEMPDVLLSAVRTMVSGATALPGDDTDLLRIREQVPDKHIVDFDERLTEARRVYRLRDERGAYTDSVATGLARRALLECGRRLLSTDTVLAPEHAVELEVTEAAALLRGYPGPTAEELAARYRWRTATTVEAPPFLGVMSGPPPSPKIFPPAARRTHRALGVILEHMLKPHMPNASDAQNGEVVVRGLSVNTGMYEGIARVVHDSAGLARVQQGDILVVKMSSPHCNVVLPLLGAIVTDRGGQLSHAAIVAREYGIPGVVGTREATSIIPDGAKVRVDGRAGEVKVLG